jgi:hypothetical protein
MWSGRHNAGRRDKLTGVVDVLVRVLERRGVAAGVFRAAVSSGLVRGVRLAARKIQRRCQGGAHGHEKEIGTKMWRPAHLESPESMKTRWQMCELRQANLPAWRRLRWEKKRGIGEDGEGVK